MPVYREYEVLEKTKNMDLQLLRETATRFDLFLNELLGNSRHEVHLQWFNELLLHQLVLVVALYPVL
jgi:hypothetical protein